jgi:hypothetical protein
MMIKPDVIDSQIVIKTGAVDENFKKSFIIFIICSNQINW